MKLFQTHKAQLQSAQDNLTQAQARYDACRQAAHSDLVSAILEVSNVKAAMPSWIWIILA